MSSCDDDWEQFLMNDNFYNAKEDSSSNILENEYIPKCSNIYISTKTKISYLNKNIDLNSDFWNIPVLDYNDPREGVIKKQIKINSKCKEEVDIISEKLNQEKIYQNYIISSIDNPDNNKVKFKDVRKITIGLSKKDIITHRCKQKSAFYNCFVLIIRLKLDNNFKECHVKIFNTGKIELPGIQSDEVLTKLLDYVVNLLKEYCGYDDLIYIPEETETVLINSNFNCGYFINRDKLYDLLRNKYRLHTLYDPCSYPGIMSKFYYNPILSKNEQTGIKSRENQEKEISFMIFRTGSVLIVGKCIESELIEIYDFLKKLLENECNNIIQNTDLSNFTVKSKKKVAKKIKKKITLLDNV
jgi:hypothetical protein